MPADPLFDRLARALAGRYHLTRELGRGGMATVYLGTDLKLNRPVAIKVLPPTTRAYLGSGRFQREVLVAAQLSHPHIVPLFEADEADGLLFYVMEYVEGESLKDRLAREGPLAVGEAIRIAAEVGDGLQYAHKHGVIHRDVKPGNILLAHGHARVADFGIAKLVEGSRPADRTSSTGSGITVGTAEYMSPEQASGSEHIDARADVYGLAAVLYEMLAGEPPFTGPSVQAIVARVLNEPPRPIRTIRPGLPAHVERALAAALAKVPADRPPSARAFVDTLTGATADRRRARRSRRLGATVGALVIAGVGILVWVVGRRPPAGARPPAGMVLVPAGAYRVGGGPGRPASVATLDPFSIDSTEVTVGAYQRYVDSAGAAIPWERKPPERWPVTGVLWAEALAYCRWRDPLGRLPTEAEWEAAAHGRDAQAYPWGNVWEAGRANAAAATDSLLPVGSLPLGRSWVGAVDMVGNAWEWVANDSVGAHGEAVHVIKGGAFDTPPRNAAVAFRAWLPEDRRTLWKTGFRCARPK